MNFYNALSSYKKVRFRPISIEIAVHFAINFAKMNEFDEVADECFLILLDYLTCTYLPYENN